MSRVIDGGNIAKQYTSTAAQFREFFDSLLDGRNYEIPRGFQVSLKGLFDLAEDFFYLCGFDEKLKPKGREPDRNALFRSWGARDLILECYRESRPSLRLGDERRIVLKIRDLTESFLEGGRQSQGTRNQAEFLKNFFGFMADKGRRERYTETYYGRPGRYSCGGRDFDEDD